MRRPGIPRRAILFGSPAVWFAFASIVFAASPAGVPSADANSEEAPIAEADRKHWSFRPLAELPAPEVREAAAASNPVDHFILARLEEEGLAFSPEAERAVLIRRLSFDLTGLPPRWEQVAFFLADPAPDAYERLVDRLLASPEYGRRWAQHWLDVVRFAESDGFEYDHERKDAWRYRDWVIGALNADIPYDEFVRMQLAGDELAPGSQDAAAATGFLMAGPDMVDINRAEERRHVFLNDMTATAGSVFLGLTLGCAQCHDHKSDPISIRDFYRMKAFFANTVVKPEKLKQLPPVVREPGASAPPTHVMIRGDFRRPGDEVLPAAPRVLAAGTDPVWIGVPGPDAVSSGRRAALAQWLTRPDNALALRVAVNRIWQHHFSVPLVDTPNDFGKGGARPSHPELLDWLARELPRRGWSLKEIHRLLVVSASYRQASHGSGPEWRRALEQDPENRLFSRMHRRRLSGEEIRDAMLVAAGRLNLRSGGPGIRPPLPAEVTGTLLKDQWIVSKDAADHERRSVYLFVRRNLRFPMFEVFDRPDPNLACARRNVSTTAPQALTLLNSEFSHAMASWLADRIWAETRPGPEAQIRAAYLQVFCREPSPRESGDAHGFLALQQDRADADGSADPARAALSDLCLALFNANEALYLD